MKLIVTGSVSISENQMPQNKYKKKKIEINIYMNFLTSFSGFFQFKEIPQRTSQVQCKDIAF